MSDETNPEPAVREGSRIAKVMARAGLCSRREAETWIAAGRVTVNGKTLESPAYNVSDADDVRVDGVRLGAPERTRLFLFHKPRGFVTTARDPEGRPTIFDALPPDLPRLIAVGRLDINTEGLMLLTNDGGLARVLELPATGWLRRYRVRAHGTVDQARLDSLGDGITLDGIHYAGIEARLDREQGSNAWITMGLREGKNREIKRVLEHLELAVNRLIRVSFGPFELGDLAEREVAEVRTRILRDQLGAEARPRGRRRFRRADRRAGAAARAVARRAAETARSRGKDRRQEYGQAAPAGLRTRPGGAAASRTPGALDPGAQTQACHGPTGGDRRGRQRRRGPAQADRPRRRQRTARAARSPSSASPRRAPRRKRRGRPAVARARLVRAAAGRLTLGASSPSGRAGRMRPRSRAGATARAATGRRGRRGRNARRAAPAPSSSRAASVRRAAARTEFKPRGERKGKSADAPRDRPPPLLRAAMSSGRGRERLGPRATPDATATARRAPRPGAPSRPARREAARPAGAAASLRAPRAAAMARGRTREGRCRTATPAGKR